METKFYNLSNPQKAIWLTEEYYKNTSINNVGGTLTMEEPINRDLLEKAISLFISSNDSLRFKLDLSQKEPLQYVAPITHYDIKYVEVNDENALKEFSNNFFKEPFEISNSFLFGFVMFNFKNEKKGGFIAKLHHLISDAWSMSILIDEIMEIYSNLLSNKPIEMTPPSYLTYIESENEPEEISMQNYIEVDECIRDLRELYEYEKDYFKYNQKSREVIESMQNILEGKKKEKFVSLKTEKEIDEKSDAGNAEIKESRKSGLEDVLESGIKRSLFDNAIHFVKRKLTNIKDKIIGAKEERDD